MNILVALLWPAQESHQRAQGWFDRHSSEGWASCAFTEAGFVRMVSHPSFSHSAVRVEEASQVLKDSTAHPKHEFWAADIAYREATELFSNCVFGHKQVTDAYLLGLAIRSGGKLVTMDRGVCHLVPEKLQGAGFVTLI